LKFEIQAIRISALLIQNSITGYHKNQERTRRKRERQEKGKIIAHMTERKRRQNLAN